MINASDILHAKILIADDQKADVLLLERMLQGAGYDSVTSTMDPYKVCELHLMNDFDLIILDLLMPGMDGFQVMQNLKEIDLGRDLPVLVVTAEPDHRARALQQGAKDFIGKPFDHAEVLIRVYNMLEIRLLHREVKERRDFVVAAQNHTVPAANVMQKSRTSVTARGRRSQGSSERPVDIFAELVTENHADATVLFVNIVPSVRRDAGPLREPIDVMERFDCIADKRGLQRVKTVAGAYLANKGSPAIPQVNHAVRAAHMALDILEDVARFNATAAHTIGVRIGIASGTAISGVIGKRKYLYGLWGDAINSAHEMESHGVVGRMQMSDATRQHLGKPFMLERRGPFEDSTGVQNNTWFLNGRNG